MNTKGILRTSPRTIIIMVVISVLLMFVQVFLAKRILDSPKFVVASVALFLVAMLIGRILK